MRAFAALLALLCAVAGLSAVTSSARADSAMLCNGYAACSANGYTTHGYPSHINTSYWGQYAGVNCTNYTAFVLSTAFHAPTPGYRLGNASDWANSASAHGVPVNGTPSVGSVAQWDGNTTGMGPAGHVAVVERVAVDGGSIDISQDSIGSDTDKYDWRRIYRGTNGWQSWPSHFIHFTIPTTWPPADGSFVQYGTAIYGIAGGAPLYISSWTSVGGAHPVRGLSTAEIRSLPYVPRNGTLLRDYRSGGIYTVAGGAPLWVTNLQHVGGPRPAITVDIAAIAYAGRPAPWNHLLAVPANGTYLRITDGHVYVVAGGAIFWLSSWATVGGGKPTVAVDSWNTGHAGDSRSHLAAVPPAGTVLRSLPSGAYWTFTGSCYRSAAPTSTAVMIPASGLAAYRAC